MLDGGYDNLFHPPPKINPNTIGGYKPYLICGIILIILSIVTDVILYLNGYDDPSPVFSFIISKMGYLWGFIIILAFYLEREQYKLKLANKIIDNLNEEDYDNDFIPF